VSFAIVKDIYIVLNLVHFTTIAIDLKMLD